MKIRAFWQAGIVGAAGCGLCLAAAPAEAQQILALEITSPEIDAGEQAVEIRAGVLAGGEDRGAWATGLEYGYGVTDWWRPALRITAVRDPGADPEVEAVGVESVFDFTGTRDWPLHLGGYVEYQFGLGGEPDDLELKLLAERETDDTLLRVNLIAQREVGAGAGDAWEYGYAAEFLWQASESVALGFEGLGELGTSRRGGVLRDHDHYLGPTFAIEHEVGSDEREFTFAAGLLFGLGAAEGETLARLSLEWEG